MSSTASPYGLVPVNHPSGVVRPFAMTILTGYASTIYQNSPVKIIASSTGEGTIAVASAGDSSVGTFQGVEWTDTDGKRRVSNKWTASTAGTDIVAYVTLDQAITYQIQSDAALNVTDIGKQYNFSAPGGNATTGISSQSLNVASATTNANVRLIGIVPGPDNAWGDTYVNALVQLSLHQNTANVAAY